MTIRDLKYGYYIYYNDGDGSMYDYFTAYDGKKNYSIFTEDEDSYYDIINNCYYSKNAKYGETRADVICELIDLLPSFVDQNDNYSIDYILGLLPRYVIEKFNIKEKEKIKVIIRGKRNG